MLRKNKFYNDNSEEKHIGKFQVDRNAMTDEGNGRISFGSKGLTITDNSEQWSGTKYDIKTLDISAYNGMLTADHSSSIQKVLGKTYGIKKVGNRVVIDAIQFAVDQNPLAVFAYEMLKAGYLTDFSTETLGPWPDEDGVFTNASLVGLSMVVAGNNRHARINEIAMQTIQNARNAGQDTAELEAILKTPIDNKSAINNNDSMTLVRIKNSRNFNLKVSFKNQEGKDEETELKPGQTVDVPETEAENVQTQVDGATDPNPAPAQPATPATPATPANGDNAIADLVKNAVADAVKPLVDDVAKFKNDFNNPVEPAFIINNKTVAIKDMSWKDRHGKQINAAWDAFKGKNGSALKVLNEINQINLEKLQEKGLVENSMTIADMGNFVISPELFSEIEGVRSSYQNLLNRFTFRDTLSTQMAWLSRNGDISMEEVEFCDDDNDGNLKPISEYSASIETSNLSEVAAVTPVCNAATRFLAVDLLGDVAEGYRTDFDRKKAQLLIARLQQAVNETGNTGAYNLATSGAGALNPLFSIVDVVAGISETISNGLWIFSQATYFELLKRRMAAGTSQDSQDIFTTGENAQFLGYPYVVVPNDLMPALNSAQTRSFTVDGASVTINQGMFFVDPSTFTGRTSGGLQYDLSTEASYEVGGEVRSAYQRNELVVRGSFFRGGAVKDPEKVAGIGRAGIS